MGSYPGLDITAGCLPFLVRRAGTAAAAAGAGGGGGRGCVSGSAIFCRLRRAAVAFAGSRSAGGLDSRAFRFFAEVVARVDGPGGGRRVEVEVGLGVEFEWGEASAELLAACLAAARVVLLLGGMSMCVL
jgi:hypothetical protein